MMVVGSFCARSLRQSVIISQLSLLFFSLFGFDLSFGSFCFNTIKKLSSK